MELPSAYCYQHSNRIASGKCHRCGELACEEDLLTYQAKYFGGLIRITPMIVCDTCWTEMKNQKLDRLVNNSLLGIGILIIVITIIYTWSILH